MNRLICGVFFLALSSHLINAISIVQRNDLAEENWAQTHKGLVIGLIIAAVVGFILLVTCCCCCCCGSCCRRNRTVIVQGGQAAPTSVVVASQQTMTSNPVHVGYNQLGQ